jgi:hypothetical protein
MRLHPLAPEVKCSACGGDLMFVRVRVHGDLYQCVSDPCMRQVMHYQRKDGKTCGYTAKASPGVRGILSHIAGCLTRSVMLEKS